MSSIVVDPVTRIEGVCTTVHALASVRAVEDTLEIAPPPTPRRSGA